MGFISSLSLWVSVGIGLQGAVIERPLPVDGEYLRFVIDPERAGTLTELELTAAPHNLVHGGGLLQEGFGVGSPYVPNRRLSQQLEAIDDGAGRSRLVYSYDSDGPNIGGLHVEKMVEPLPGESSVRVRWRVENQGDETHWMAPWVHNDVAPGGSVDAADRVDVPSIKGIEQAESTGYWTAARNWIAVTDTAERETIYAVFNAAHIHSYEVIRDVDAGALAFKALFVPRAIAPGETWETTFRVGVVRGLTHVDCATDEFAAQLDYEPGRLKFLMSAVTTMPYTEIHGVALPVNGEAEPLKGKRFTIAPDNLVRCTYSWRPSGNGPYDFLAQLRRDGASVELGGDTNPPHGGVDTRIALGRTQDAHFEPWTDGPFALDRGPQTLARAMAVGGDTKIWFESSLTKVFRHDNATPTGEPDPAHRVTLAQNERESFQIVLRPPEDKALKGVEVRAHDLVHGENGVRLSKSSIAARRVGYVPVRIGSHFENPTGDYPDPLFPIEPFTANGGQCSPIWVTVHAPTDTAPGTYRGPLELYFANAQPVELWLEVEVLDFALPEKPALKTSFGFSPERAQSAGREQGYRGTRDALITAYRASAEAHRITLRNIVPFPSPGDGFIADLDRFEARIERLQNSPATTIAVPSALLEEPQQLERASRFIRARQLSELAFVHIADNPPPSQRSAALERMKRWRQSAPGIPMMITSKGLQPFFVEECQIWTPHTRIFDTPNNQALLDRIEQDGEVWWYVDEGPPRPYANLFIDFGAIEHRVLFWQAWALGIQGMYYGDVNHVPEGKDPYDAPVVGAPVNGNTLLIYPGAAGPVDSIRWEIVRDGIEDYDYLAILLDRTRTLREQRGDTPLVGPATSALELGDIIASLTTFTRKPEELTARRNTIGKLIVEIDAETSQR